MDASTVKRDLRTGRSLWTDSTGLGVPVRELRAPLSVDVAIVGSGISGAFMAHELSQDFSVAVLDRRAPLTGSTIASTAMLQWELDKPLTALSDQIGEGKARRVYRRSLAAVDDLKTIVRRERIACAFRAKASLYLAGDEYGSRALATEAKARAAIGLESIYLPPAVLRERFGLDRTGAILSAGSASADPGRLAAGLLRRAQARGAKVLSPLEVTGVFRGTDHLTLVADTDFEVQARHVVFCCGYEFPRLVPTEGAQIISTWALASRPLETAPGWLAEHLVWEASDPYLYFRMSGDGRLVIGGEDEASPDRHGDPGLLAAKARRIVAKFQALMPDVPVEIDYTWAGAFGQSATSMPLIGAVPGIPNAYAVMGFGGNGITYSVIASQIVSTAIRGETDPDADLFRFG